MNRMKLAVLQTDIVWAAPEKNIANAERLMKTAPGADLYILPEMFSTGFCTSPEGTAEEDPAVSLGWMREKSSELGCAIAGSIAIHENGSYRNRFYFVKPDGSTEYYDKKHLFTYSGENLRYTAGDRRTVVEFMGTRILLQVCYDLRFPVWSRNTGDYDMIIYVASWPEPRIEAWKTLLKARAIENQCYVCGVNRVGTDPSCRYCGGSAVIDPYGNVLASCDDWKESAAAAETDMGLLQEFRASFPVLDDADAFHIGRN